MVAVVVTYTPPTGGSMTAAASPTLSSSNTTPWRPHPHGGPLRRPCVSRARLCFPPRAALAEASRPSAAVVRRDGGSDAAIQLADRGNGAVAASSSAPRRPLPPPRDRADDLQAETRALARAAGCTVYTPQLLADKYGPRPIKVALRTLEVLTALGKFAATLLLDERSGQLDQRKRMRAEELRGIFTRLGPTFVKIGQGLSTRPDICPPEYLEELSELQDALPTFPDADAFSCIEKELGMPLDSIFSSISPSPIAAASLGQVYKARLKSSRQVVAVKVQRPGIEEAIGLDFYLLRGLGFLINKYVDIISSDVVALIDEFARRVYQELNYVQEGQNARRFKKLYADKEDVLVPDIFWDYTSAKVLTMEWVDGVKLNEQEAIEKQGLKVLDLVNTGIQCSLRQLLEYGYFHADPHPGNLLATPEGKLAFLDFGMMSETPEEARLAIIGHVVHMVNRDYEAMAQDYYALDFLSSDVDVSPIVPALRNFFDDALNSTVSELNFKTIVDGLGNVLYQFPFNVPAYYALILRSLTVLEGLALYADPNFKVLAASYPYFAKRLLTDSNPYLRDALIELLFKDGRFRWNRLENLLVQGRKDRDFTAEDALQPVLKLLLDPDGEELRALVVKEAVYVTEAVVLGTMIDTYKSAPDFMRALVPNGSAIGPFKLKEGEQEQMLELRDRVFRIWRLLRSSDNFDPSLLRPVLQSTMQKEVISGNAVSEASGRVRHRKHSNEVPPDASKVNKAHLLIDDRNKYKSMCIRVHSSIWMIGGFVFVVYMGHLYIWALIVGIQILMAKELFNLLRKANEDRRLPGFRLQNWHFFFTAMVFVYGRFLSRQLVNTVTTDNLLYRLISGLIKYQMFICYFLYIAGFVWFILTLKKKMYKYQFGQYAWTHMILFWVFAQSSFAVANIFEGIFWFLLPASLIVINDIAAYFFGFFFGRTPLIKLSPKKTWEGFVGASVATIISAFMLANVLGRFQWLTCPRKDLSTGWLYCDPGPMFKPEYYSFPEWVLSWFPWEGLTILPVQWHSLAFGLFASIIAPFGGFFASGFKRAFKLKDFGDSIPGHGGITDRMDCQMVMAVFAYIYHQSFIIPENLSVETILDQILRNLTFDEQLLLYGQLGKILQGRD